MYWERYLRSRQDQDVLFHLHLKKCEVAMNPSCLNNTPSQSGFARGKWYSYPEYVLYHLASFFYGKLVSLQSSTVSWRCINMSINKQCDLLNLWSKVFVTVGEFSSCPLWRETLYSTCKTGWTDRMDCKCIQIQVFLCVPTFRR